MAGVTFPEVGIGEINVGVGTNGYFDDDETYIYEASYGWDINDGMSTTVGAFISEGASGVDDTTGIASTLSFSF